LHLISVGATILKIVATYGYGYTRSEVAKVASDYAVQIGTRRPSDAPFTRGWFEGFIKRWPELKVFRPRSLDLVKANSAFEETIDNYFHNQMQLWQLHYVYIHNHK
jgi:hypothetical protein